MERMKLLPLVIERRERVSKALFKEMTTENVAPFRMDGEVANIEKCMWECSCKTASFSASSMHDQFQYLFTLNGVLRVKSLYLADLSDLCNFIFHHKQVVDPDMCLIF